LSNDVFEKLDGKLKDARKKFEPFYVLRNKQVGHNDMETALGAAELPAIVRQDVDAALHTMAEFLNDIRDHFTGSEVYYKKVVMLGGGEELIAYLDAGLRSIERPVN
jgi:hypothetical protein